MRAARVAIVVTGVLCLALALGRLTEREVDRAGLCGSIVQGSSWDDGGASTRDCNRLRHDDEVVTAAFFTLALVSLGMTVGRVLHVRTKEARGP